MLLGGESRARASAIFWKWNIATRGEHDRQSERLTNTVVADGEQWLRRHTLADVAHARVQVANMPEMESDAV